MEQHYNLRQVIGSKEKKRFKRRESWFRQRDISF